MTRDQTEPENHSASLRKKRLIVTSWIAAILLILAFFGIGPVLLNAYDREHPVTKACEVTTAQAGSSSTVSRTGIGGSSEQVVVESKNCGELLLREGVNKDNSDEIASGLTPGNEYDFILGGGSVRLEKLLDFFGRSIEARLT
jgi:hypothetical protein